MQKTLSKSWIFNLSQVLSISLLFLQSVQLQAATYYVRSFKAGVFDAPGIHAKSLHTFKRGESVEGPDLKVVYEVAEQLGVAITEVMKYSIDEIQGLISKLELGDEEGKLTGAEEADRYLPGQKVQQSEGWLQVTWDGGQGWMRKKTLSPRPIRQKIVLGKKTYTVEKKKIHFRMRVHQLEKEKSVKQGDVDFNLTNPDEHSVESLESFVQDEEYSVNFLLNEDS